MNRKRQREYDEYDRPRRDDESQHNSKHYNDRDERRGDRDRDRDRSRDRRVSDNRNRDNDRQRSDSSASTNRYKNNDRRNDNYRENNNRGGFRGGFRGGNRGGRGGGRGGRGGGRSNQGGNFNGSYNGNNYRRGNDTRNGNYLNVESSEMHRLKFYCRSDPLGSRWYQPRTREDLRVESLRHRISKIPNSLHGKPIGRSIEENRCVLNSHIGCDEKIEKNKIRRVIARKTKNNVIFLDKPLPKPTFSYERFDIGVYNGSDGNEYITLEDTKPSEKNPGMKRGDSIKDCDDRPVMPASASAFRIRIKPGVAADRIDDKLYQIRVNVNDVDITKAYNTNHVGYLDFSRKKDVILFVLFYNNLIDRRDKFWKFRNSPIMVTHLIRCHNRREFIYNNSHKDRFDVFLALAHSFNVALEKSYRQDWDYAVNMKDRDRKNMCTLDEMTDFRLKSLEFCRPDEKSLAVWRAQSVIYDKYFNPTVKKFSDQQTLWTHVNCDRIFTFIKGGYFWCEDADEIREKPRTPPKKEKEIVCKMGDVLGAFEVKKGVMVNVNASEPVTLESLANKLTEMDRNQKSSLAKGTSEICRAVNENTTAHRRSIVAIHEAAKKIHKNLMDVCSAVNRNTQNHGKLVDFTNSLGKHVVEHEHKIIDHIAKLDSRVNELAKTAGKAAIAPLATTYGNKPVYTPHVVDKYNDLSVEVLDDVTGFKEVKANLKKLPEIGSDDPNVSSSLNRCTLNTPLKNKLEKSLGLPNKKARLMFPDASTGFKPCIVPPSDTSKTTVYVEWKVQGSVNTAFWKQTGEKVKTRGDNIREETMKALGTAKSASTCWW